jgi:hypothetical protein
VEYHTTRKRELVATRNRAKIRAIQRAANIAAWNDYIDLVVSKTLGLGGLVVGGLEYLSPDTLPVTLPNPAWVAGAGLALLTGKRLITLIAKLEKGKR